MAVFSFLLVVASSRWQSVARSRKRLCGGLSLAILKDLLRVGCRRLQASPKSVSRDPARTNVRILGTESSPPDRAQTLEELLSPTPWVGETHSGFHPHSR